MAVESTESIYTAETFLLARDLKQDMLNLTVVEPELIAQQLTTQHEGNLLPGGSGEKSKTPTPLSTADSRRTSPTRSESRSPKPSKNALNRRFSLVSLNPEGAQSSGSTSASRSSRDSSDFLSRYSYIILRKIYKNGKWYEERQETIYTMRTDGKPSTRSSVSQSELNMTETPEYSEYLSKIDPNFLGIERAIKAFPKGGRGIFQDDQEEFGKEILAKINEYRQKHEGKNIKLNKNLSVYAREWANYLARNSKIGFSNRHDVGEAIFARTTSEPWTKISGDDVVEKWYSEIETHDFENPHEIKAANFTQVVWRSTKEIGVALERSQDGLISYVVVFFHPKGNFPGDVTKQVIGVGDNLNKLKNKKGVMEPQAVDKTESFYSAVLRAANYYRLLHGVLPLVLDNALSIYAQEWADQLALEDKIRPRPNNVYGENLYLSSFKINSDLHGQEPVEYWYGTKKYHSHFKEPADIRAAPFTQLIWGASRDIGVGFAKSKTDRTYVAAYFNPPGNLVGQFGKEVLPMKWNMP